MPNEYDVYVWLFIVIGLALASAAKFAKDEWF